MLSLDALSSCLTPTSSHSVGGLAPFLGAILADGWTGKKMLQLLCGWWMVAALAILLVGVLPSFGGPIAVGDVANPIREGSSQSSSHRRSILPL